MKKIVIKILIIICITILVCNTLSTTVLAYKISEKNELNSENESIQEENIVNEGNTTNTENNIDSEMTETEIEDDNEIQNEISTENKTETEPIEQTEVQVEKNNEIQNEIKTEEKAIETIKSEAEEEFSLCVDISGYKVNTYIKNNIYYLFLPQGVNISNLEINYTGNIVSISSGTINTNNKTINNDFSNNDTIIITDNNNINYTVKVMQTDLPSISISLKDTTLDIIDNGSKDTKYPGNELTIAGASDEDTNKTYQNVEIKGRGNFTWGLEKKAYQIKFDSKENLFGMGKAKKWILLANHADASLMRNEIVFDLAKKIGLESIDSQYVDLWVDGEYRGNYLLCEKAEIGKNRVNLKEDDGVLIEMDNTNYGDDPYIVSETSKTVFALKESVADDVDEENSKALQYLNDFKTYIDEFETLLYSKDKDWDKISKMIDVESFIKYYFIQEFSENPDGCRSSVYMYKDGKDDVIHMGPVWDYDSALANYTHIAFGGDPEIDYIANITKYMGSSNDWYEQLFKIDEFKELVIKTYEETVKPALATVNEKINKTQELLKHSADMNFIRWNILGRNSVFGGNGHAYEKTYAEEVKYMSDWVEKRINYLNNSCKIDNTQQTYKVRYQTHVQDKGWTSWAQNGATSGTAGELKRIEAIRIKLGSSIYDILNANIKYRTHVENYGWMDWKQNGELSGTEGECKRIEAIQIQLDNEEGYSVEYRVHVQDYGWMDWVRDGEIAGTQGESKRIEAIEIRIIKPKILYCTHIQDIGWEKDFSKYDGMTSGTSGQSKRLEAIKIKLGKLDEEDVHITYQVHAQDYGWMNWVKDGEMAGTQGESKRLESIRIKLENSSKYTVKYRVHVQDYGWTDWVSEGEEAGTTGQMKRLEAIEIQILDK